MLTQLPDTPLTLPRSLSQERDYLRQFAYLRKIPLAPAVISSSVAFEAFLRLSYGVACEENRVQVSLPRDAMAFPLLRNGGSIWALCVIRPVRGKSYRFVRYAQCLRDETPLHHNIAWERKPLLLEYSYFKKEQCRELVELVSPSHMFAVLSRGKFVSLYHYILCIFARQVQEEHIAWSEDGKCTAFCTGLRARKGHEPPFVYGSFGTHKKRGVFFRGWHKPGSTEMDRFSRLPEPLTPACDVG